MSMLKRDGTIAIGNGCVPNFRADELRGYSTLGLNGVVFVESPARDDEDTKAMSEAIAEQAEELELAKAELRAYRMALSVMTPRAQLRAALEVNGIPDNEAERIVASWSKIQNL